MSLLVQIAAEFVGKKQFKEASKAVTTLQGSVKKLAGAAGLALSTAAVVKFGKNAVKAFAENEKSAKRLETVVKNLGLAFETPGIEASLDKISAKFGYEGEVLREAFQKLITTTGSAKKSQDLLNLSLDIAAGSGVDLLTVNQDLAAAYTGQTRGLRKYNLGLTQSELKTLDFDSAVSKLTANFKGAGSAELQTYAGQMRILQESADNAQEIIGGGLVDALMILSGDTSVEDLAVTMETLASNTASAITEIAKLGKAVANFATESYGKVDSLANRITDLLDRLTGNEERITRRNVGQAGRMFAGGSGGVGFNIEEERLRRQAEAAAAKRAKELAALQKKTLDTQKKSLALQKASKTLNLDAIGIEAALKGKISETDRISLLLQKAILEGNANLATSLSDQLDAAIKREKELRQSLLSTPEAPNPFRNWTLPMDLLNYTASSLGVSVAQLQNTPVVPTSTFSDAEMELAAAVNRFQGANAQAINIEVYLDGDIVGGAVTNSQINSSLSGSFNQINRGASSGAVAL